MDLLKRELERKRKALQLTTPVETVSAGKRSRRYLRVGDLRRTEEELLGGNGDRTQNTTLASSRSGRNDSVDEIDTKSQVNDDPNDKIIEIPHDANEINAIPDTDNIDPHPSPIVHVHTTEKDETELWDLKTQLRAMGLPVHIFGESGSDRQARLNLAKQQRKETLLSLSEKEEFRLGKGHGIRNPFLEKHLENDRSESIITGETKEPKGLNPLADEEADEDGDPHKRVYRYFKGLLKGWEEDLSKRPEEIKRTASGKNETKTLKQCKDYIRPLFQLCKTRKLEENLLAHLLQIVEHCKEGDFVKANDVYMDVAIGRAAWPIGVTMVGIHARSGRAKIESKNVAHVMNSELQRKYLTSVKRLMTYAQNKRVDVNPSKKVMN